MNGNDSKREMERPPAPLSLQDSAITTVVKNIGGYRELITKNISPPMRNIIFDQAMERIKEIGADQAWAALPYLDQHRTTESFSTKDFPSLFRLKGESGVFSKGCVSMEQFLQYLVEFVPNLRQLNIEDPRRTSPHNWFYFKKVQLEPLATELLLQMKNLTHISIIDVYIKISGFASVCRESPNLQSIEANNILVDKKPKSIKKLLKTLDSNFGHQEYDAMKYPRKIGITLKKANSDKPYREAKVSLSNDLHDLFPSLTQLEISTLNDRDLGLYDIRRKRNHLLRILRRVGETLKTLILESIRPELNIKFKHIFNHCNQLETLILRDSIVSDDDKIASFGHLKKLEWNDTFHGKGTIKLNRIFSAPLLEVIDIITSQFRLGDKKALLKQIRDRTIFTNLTDFRILCYAEHVPDEKGLNELSSELRSLGVNETIHVGTNVLYTWYYRM